MEKENKFIIFMNKFAVKIDQNTYLSSIKNAFSGLSAVIIVGSFISVFSKIIFENIERLGQFSWLYWLATNLHQIADFINNFIYNCLALCVAFLSGNELGERDRINGFFAGVIALVSYLAINLNSIQIENNVQLLKIFPKQCTGIKGLFLGILIAIFSIQLYIRFSKLLQKSVWISPSITACLSFMLTVIMIFAAGFITILITHVSLLTIIYNLIQSPLQNIIQSLPGILLLVLITQLFWLTGLHGIQIIKPIREPLLLTATVVNFEAYFAGKTWPNIVTMPFWNIFVNMSGSGITLGLLFAIFLIDRKYQGKKLLDIAKTALIPGIFNINESVIFGIPIVQNRILSIPFLITPLVTGAIGYIAIATGFVARAYAYIPCPIFIDGFLATGGDWRAVIVQMICMLVATLIYLPFVKEYENQKVLLKA